jgi:hypothetical protein
MRVVRRRNTRERREVERARQGTRTRRTSHDTRARGGARPQFFGVAFDAIADSTHDESLAESSFRARARDELASLVRENGQSDVGCDTRRRGCGHRSQRRERNKGEPHRALQHGFAQTSRGSRLAVDHDREGREPEESMAPARERV